MDEKQELDMLEEDRTDWNEFNMTGEKERTYRLSNNVSLTTIDNLVKQTGRKVNHDDGQKIFISKNEEVDFENDLPIN